ncbi:MAG: hypothetical protein AAF376_08265 [Pseudomonadota bacterium]
MFPVMINSPITEFPGSGDVTQDIETSWFSQMRGSPELEYKIITEIWSYGDQLGTLTDALLEVAEAQGWQDTPALEKLRAKAAEVKTAKREMRDRLRDRAELALKHLRDVDEEGYQRVMRGA